MSGVFRRRFFRHRRRIVILTYTLPLDNPTITNAEDETFDSTETDIVITGTDFGTKTGSADLELGDSATYGSATLVSQSTDSWSDTSIQFDLTLGALNGETSLWLYVTDSVGTVSNAWAVTIVYPPVTIKYKEGKIGAPITDEGIDLVILLQRDE